MTQAPPKPELKGLTSVLAAIDEAVFQMDEHQKLLNKVASREASNADPDAARGFSHSSAFESLALFQEQLATVVQGYGQPKLGYVPPKFLNPDPGMQRDQMVFLFYELKGKIERQHEFQEFLARDDQMGMTTYNRLVGLALSAEQVLSTHLAARPWRFRDINLVSKMVPVYEDFKRSLLAIDEASNAVIQANCLYKEPDPFAEVLTRKDICTLGFYLNHLTRKWNGLFADLESVFHRILPDSVMG